MSNKLKISTLKKGLVLDVPCTSRWLSNSTDALDRSSYRTNMSGISTPIYNADGVTLNGTSQYLKKSTSDWRPDDTQGTVSLWFKRVLPSPDGGADDFFSTSDESSNNHWFVFRVNAADDYIYFTVREYPGFYDTLRGSTLVQDENWHHAVLVSNGSSYSLYLDGQEETLTVTGGSNSGKWFGDVTARDHVMIGARRILADGSGHGGFWYGSVTNVKVWNRPLSFSEIQELFELGQE